MSHYSEDFSEQDEEWYNNKMAEKIQQLKAVFSGKSSHYFGSLEMAEVIAHLGVSGAYDTAWQAISLGLQMHPSSPDIKLNAAWVAAQQGDQNRAEKLLSAVHLESFSDAGLYELAANIESELGNFDKAIDYCKLAIDLESDRQEDLLMNLAFQFAMANNNKEAIAVLKQVILLNPSNKFAQMELRTAMEDEADDWSLIDFYLHSLKNHTHTLELSLELADILYFNDLLEDSLSVLSAYEQRGGTDFWAQIYMARTLYGLGEDFQAERVIDALIDNTAMPPAELLCQLALCLADEGDTVDVKQFYLRAVKADPDCLEAMLQLSEIYLQEERDDEGLYWLKMAQLADNKDTTTAMLYAMALKHYGRKHDAIEAFEHALSLGPLSSSASMAFATALFELGHQSDAFSVLAEGIIINDFEAGLLYLMAWYKSLAKDTTEAKDFLYLAAQQDPKGIDTFISAYPEAESSPLISAFMRSGNI